MIVAAAALRKTNKTISIKDIRNIFLGNRTKRRITKHKNYRTDFFLFIFVHTIRNLVSFILFFLCDDQDSLQQRKMCHILAICVKLLQQTEHRSEMNSQVFMRLCFFLSLVGTRTKIQIEHILQFDYTLSTAISTNGWCTCTGNDNRCECTKISTLFPCYFGDWPPITLKNNDFDWELR